MQYFYILVRKDIPLADQICQVAHAAADAGRDFRIPAHTNVVVLAVADSNELAHTAQMLSYRDVDNRQVFEPDDDIGFAALATRIVNPEERQLFRHFKLWRP